MTTAPKLARAAALTGGVAWLLDTIIITARGGAFGAPDSVLYLTGLFGLVLAAGAAGYAWRRSPGAVAGVLAAAVVATAVEAVGHAVLGGEYGLMACGAIAVALAAWVTSAGRVPSS